MSVQQKSKVVVDTERNCLHITITANISKAELEKIYQDIKVGVPELRGDFSVITDLSQAGIGYLDGLPALQRIMGFLVENRVGKVIRIVERKKALFQQLSHLPEQSLGYSPVYVETLDEAMNLLAVDEG